jgi:hypothetical protein
VALNAFFRILLTSLWTEPFKRSTRFTPCKEKGSHHFKCFTFVWTLSANKSQKPGFVRHLDSDETNRSSCPLVAGRSELKITRLQHRNDGPFSSTLYALVTLTSQIFSGHRLLIAIKDFHYICRNKFCFIKQLSEIRNYVTWGGPRGKTSLWLLLLLLLLLELELSS